MAELIDPEKCSVLRAAPRLMQILRVLGRRKFLGALFGRSHWPSPKEVRETFEELGLVFLKLGQVLALRRDLLPAAYIDELLLLHDQLPAMGIALVRATVERELGAPLTSSLHRETDFGREARSIVLIRAALADVPDLWIPDVIAECSGDTVLTMEYSAGERADVYAKLHPEAMPRVVNTLVKLMLHSIFEEGLFHADPHPGNVFVLPDGRLSLLDFGNTGDLDEPMRESLTLLLEAVVKGDARAATEAYLEMAPANEKVNRVELLVDIKAVLYEIRRTNLANVSIGNAFQSGARNGALDNRCAQRH